MASWDNVQAPGPPGAPSYAAPLFDFSDIKNLPESYFKGTQQKRTLALQNAFPDGLPKGPDGQPDIRGITDTLAKLGGAPEVGQVMPLLMQQQLLNQPPVNEPGGQGQPSPQASQRPPIPEHGIPQPALSSAGTDNSGGDTVRSMASELAGNRELPKGMIENFAKALGTDPDSPLSPNQLARARQIIGPSIGRIAQAQQQPQQPQAQQAAQPAASTLPPGYTEDMAQKLDAAGQEYMRRGGIKETLKLGSGAAEIARGKAMQDRAADIRKAVVDRGPGAMEQKRQEESQKLTIEAGQKTYNGIQAASTQYERDLKPYLDVSKSVLNDPQMYTGIGANIALNVNKVRAVLGDSKAAMLQEALQKVTASSVLGQINTQRDQLMEAGGQSSRIFSQQVSLVEKAAPALANTLAGNRFLVEVSSRMGELSTKIAEMSRAYRKSHGYLDPGFDEDVANYMKSHPVFTKQEMDNPALLGVPTAPSNIKSKDAAKAWGKSMGLNPGDPIRTSDGQIQTVP